MHSDQRSAKANSTQQPRSHDNWETKRLGYLGFAALLLWVGTIGSQWSPLAANAALSVEDLSWVLIGLASAVCALLALRRRPNKSSACLRVMGDVTSAVLMITCSACVACDMPDWPSWVMYLLMTVECSAATWGLMRWGTLLGKVKTQRLIRIMTANTCVVFACKVIMNWGDSPLGGSAFVSMTLICPALSLAGLCICQGIPQEIGAHIYRRAALKSLGGVALFVLLFSIILRLLDVLTQQTQANAFSDAIAFCTLLFLVAWVFVWGKQIDFYQSVKALLVVTSLCSFAYATANGIVQLAAFGLLWGVRELTRFYLFLLMADIAFHSDESPVVFFGIGWAFCGISRLPFCLVSEQALMHVDCADGGYVSLVLALILLLLFIIMAFAFYRLPAGLRPPLADTRPYQLQSEEETSGLDSFCSSLTKQYELTARETQIARYLCNGRSKKYIAETLFISENTVKFHLRNLYRKLGISSKQEIIDLYEHAVRQRQTQ